MATAREEFLTAKRRVCCDVANLATYLLQYNYEEIGWFYHHGKGIGHAYNFVNPKAEGLFEYIIIPHEEIPRQVPSWFRDEVEDRTQWDLYK